MRRLGTKVAPQRVCRWNVVAARCGSHGRAARSAGGVTNSAWPVGRVIYNLAGRATAQAKLACGRQTGRLDGADG